MDRKKFKFWQKIIALSLTVVFLFQPLIGVGVLAESEPTQEMSEPTQAPQTTPEPTTEPQNNPSPTASEEAPTPSSVVATNEDTSGSNEANASRTQITSVSNDNSAQVTNDVSATANTGENQVNSPQPTSTPEQTSETLSLTPSEAAPTQTETTPTPNPDEGTSCPEPSPTSGISQTPTPDQDSGSAQSDGEASFSPIPTLEVPPTPGPVAENIDTPDNSQNDALCKSESKGFVANDNQAEVENGITATASSGQNETSGEETKTETGVSTVSADLANVVNFNIVGENFWQEVFNQLGVNNGDLDFSQIDLEQDFNEAIVSVLAKNQDSGDSSVNIAAADFLESLVIFNNNIATISNFLDLTAISGQNLAIGGDGEIYTGNALIYANLFNLINTNLVGTNFWFGIFNIFGEQNGDIILPYELQFMEGSETQTGNVAAVNENPGENSQNLANASGSNVTSVQNTNQAEIKNSVDVLADSGNNLAEVCESGQIKTGDAQTSVDIRNFVNTNIFGGRFVFLLINIFGKWQGALLNWWGGTTENEKTLIASAQLPAVSDFRQSEVGAINENTGDSSSNTAQASLETSLEVVNTNQVFLNNEIKAQAISGQNEVLGDSAKIQTGNSSVIANIANFVNTNIIGNNFFFGIINIFGNLCGNILFPRPDLEIQKSVDKETAAPGETLTYTISYKNTGRLWAKNVEIVDNLPAGVTFVSASNGGVLEGGKIVWKLGKISSGEGGTLSAAVKVNNNVPENTELVNQVSVSTVTEEPNKDNNRGSASSVVKVTSPGEGVGGPGVGGPTGEGAGAVGVGGPCVPPEAPKAPILLSATAISSSEVELVWTAVDRASYYLVAYGQSSGNYIYGSPNVGNVTTYPVGGLAPGRTYYFVVAAVADGVCPAAGPFSNELSAAPGYGLGGILGVKEILAAQKEGELGGGVSTEAGEVAGAAEPVCPWWWIVLLGEALILGGFYALILKKVKSPRFWWLTAPTLVVLAFLGDKLAHKWWIPSQYCQYVPWGGLLIGGIESLAFKFFKKGVKE